eukprot:CAMPEP_0201591572 /NCGR_PEP_ID=MMETSP0190_2-20130828/189710_1 /ASSEMBLY_ACC=CAM_ASM_000263 /TAXON_ID=37353 /ORGANISM="Rosalina sp." /LENGTH=446 /DNA_ID=CAMNT_0048049965 /DNA_START=450 /DNA_END=1790 /DNA_ORIENTATION=-
MGYNIAFAASSAVPGVGELTDIFWSAYSNSAGGPISSAQQLTNNLINDINEKTELLKQCMDSKISDLEGHLYLQKAKSIVQGYYDARASSGSDREDAIDQLFNDFSKDIAEIFTGDSEYNYHGYEQILPVYIALVPLWAAVSSDQLFSEYNYYDYEQILPVYIALVPLWAAVSSDQLLIQKVQGDTSNFNSDVDVVLNGFNTMKSWITKASNSIKSSLTPPDNQQDLNCKQIFYYWNTGSTGRSIRLGDVCVMDDVWSGKIICEPRFITSAARNTKCGVTMTPSTDGTECDAWKNFIVQKRTDIMKELSVWMEVFNTVYINKINLYIESLKRIKEGDITSDNILKDNKLEIKNMKGKCLDIYGPDYDSDKNGGKVQIWPCNGGNPQKWYYDMDTKEISNMKGKCLDIYGPDYDSNKNGGKVQIWPCNGLDTQKWTYDWTTLELKNE